MESCPTLQMTGSPTTKNCCLVLLLAGVAPLLMQTPGYLLLGGSSLAVHSHHCCSVGVRLALAGPAAVFLAGEGLWERDMLLGHILLVDVGLHGPTMPLHALKGGQWRSGVQQCHNLQQADGGIPGDCYVRLCPAIFVGLTTNIDFELAKAVWPQRCIHSLPPATS